MNYRHPYSIVPAKAKRRGHRLQFLRVFWMEMTGIVVTLAVVVIVILNLYGLI